MARWSYEHDMDSVLAVLQMCNFCADSDLTASSSQIKKKVAAAQSGRYKIKQDATIDGPSPEGNPMRPRSRVLKSTESLSQRVDGRQRTLAYFRQPGKQIGVDGQAPPTSSYASDRQLDFYAPTDWEKSPIQVSTTHPSFLSLN